MQFEQNLKYANSLYKEYVQEKVLHEKTRALVIALDAKIGRLVEANASL